jgi:hypothetical protein
VGGRPRQPANARVTAKQDAPVVAKVCVEDDAAFVAGAELRGHLTYCINVLSADDSRQKIFFETAALYCDLLA